MDKENKYFMLQGIGVTLMVFIINYFFWNKNIFGFLVGILGGIMTYHTLKIKKAGKPDWIK